MAVQARLEMLENKVKLSAQKSQLLETKAEKILQEQTSRPTGEKEGTDEIMIALVVAAWARCGTPTFQFIASNCF